MKSRVAFDPEFDAPVKGREKARPERRRILEWLISMSIVAPIVWIMFVPIVGSPNWGKPLGWAIPNEPPEEANRVVHPQGFSIVLPPNWESRIVDSGSFAAIGATPRMLIPARWSASFGVERRPPDHPLDLAEYRSTTFQGKPAYKRITTRPGSLLDDPPLFTYVLVFQRDGAWYELMYHVADELRSLPPIMRQYFDTLVIRSASNPTSRG